MSTGSSVIPINGVHPAASPPAAPQQQQERQSVDVLDEAKRLQIRNSIEYLGACDAKLAIDEMIRNRHAVHDPAVAAAFASHQAACKARSADIDPLEEAKRLYQRALDKWRSEQEQIAAENARRERELVETQAAQAREAEIEEAEAAGAKPEEVAAIVERPMYVPPVMQTRAPVPVVKGIRKSAPNWKAGLDPKDSKALWTLIQFVARNPQYENLLQINQSSADALAKGLKTLMNIPGLVAFDAKSV